MIQKYVDNPDAISSRPAFSTENYDVYFLSCFEPCELETHDDYSDTYFACEQGGEYGFPVCTVYVERSEFKDGRVLNQVLNIAFNPMVCPACVDDPLVRMLAEASPKSFWDGALAELLTGIQEFAGPVAFDHLAVDNCHTFPTEDQNYEQLSRKLVQLQESQSNT